MAEAIPTERQLAVLRYLRDHGVATAATVAHEVFHAPRTNFGRTLRLRPAERELATLVSAGLVVQGGQSRRAEYMLTTAGRHELREAALRRPGDG